MLLHTSLVYTGRKRESGENQSCMFVISVFVSWMSFVTDVFIEEEMSKTGLIALILSNVMEVRSVSHTQKMMMMASLCRNNTQLSI